VELLGLHAGEEDREAVLGLLVVLADEDELGVQRDGFATLHAGR
jgi:hypothetical protein